MKRFLFLLALLFLLLFLMQIFQEEEKSVPTSPLPDRSLFLVVIDGPRYSETTGDPTHQYIPYLWEKLRPKGTILKGFRNTGQTYTNPGHLSMITGQWQSVANNGSERAIQPNIFEYYRSHYQAPESTCTVFSSKGKLSVCTYGLSPSYGSQYQAEDLSGYQLDHLTFQVTLEHLKKKHPRLVLISFRSPDSAGHSNNWERYLQAIQYTDKLLFNLWEFLQEDPFYKDKTNLIMTNDHGRHLPKVQNGFVNHGCSCQGCQQINFFAIGPAIKEDQVLETSHTLIDICPTIGQIMGFKTPYAKGEIIKQILKKEELSEQVPPIEDPLQKASTAK